MTERSIIMSAESVRAILDGRKTQTRRVIKFRNAPFGQLQEHSEWRQAVQIPESSEWIFWDHDLPSNLMLTRKAYKAGDGIKCPYGKPGDRLWVKETYRLVDEFGDSKWDTFNYVEYRAEPSWVRISTPIRVPQERYKPGWRPLIYMPREYSRILLEITAVRVERLQDIDPLDCVAEGASGYDTALSLDTHIKRFSDLWDKLNTKRGYPWSSNPWVWVIEFRRVEP